MLFRSAYRADEHWSPYFGQIVEDLMKGDLNNDGEINLADVNMLIDKILDGNQDAIGDINGDGEVNIADVNALLDYILS